MRLIELPKYKAKLNRVQAKTYPNPEPNWGYLAWHASLSKTFIPMFFKYAAFHLRLENQTLTEVAERKANDSAGLVRFNFAINELVDLIKKQELTLENAEQLGTEVFLSVEHAINMLWNWENMKFIVWMEPQLNSLAYAHYLMLINVFGIYCELCPSLCMWEGGDLDELKGRLPPSLNELMGHDFGRVVGNGPQIFQREVPFDQKF